MRPRLTYANVMATAAVFIALGGGAYAVSLAKNSVGSKQIRTNAVKGKDAKESSFAQVPSAASATDADTVDGKQASELQTSSAFAHRTNSLALTGSNQDVLSTSITTTSSRVIAVAHLSVSGDGGDDDRVQCNLRIAGFLSPGQSQLTVPATNSNQSLLAATFTAEPGPGTHTVSLLCHELGGTVSADRGELSVWAVDS